MLYKIAFIKFIVLCNIFLLISTILLMKVKSPQAYIPTLENPGGSQLQNQRGGHGVGYNHLKKNFPSFFSENFLLGELMIN